MLVLIFILVLNFGISWWNAYVCGKLWVEAKHVGGFIRILVWCGAIQSAIGFSSIYLAGLLGVGYLFQLWPPEVYELAMSFWYLAIIFPALGTGLIITLHSWQEAFRERDLLSMGSAAYNTLAMAHNAAQAVSGVGQAVGTVVEGFTNAISDTDDGKAKLFLVALFLAVIAILAGTLTTAALIKKYAGTVPLPQRAVA